MDDINIINFIDNDNLLINNKKVSSFDRLCNLQKLVKKESMLNELCK